MSNSVPFSGKLVEKLSDRVWSDFATKVFPELQFLNLNWYLSWESKYLPLENPSSSLRYISILDNEGGDAEYKNRCALNLVHDSSTIFIFALVCWDEYFVQG